MAFIGMRHPVVARIKSHTHGNEPTYEKGMVMGNAMAGNLTITRNSNPLRADDVIVEDDNGITGMSLDLGVDDITEDVRVYAMGLEENKNDGGDGVPTYDDTDESAPDTGTGYIRVRRRKGKTIFQAVWMFKGTFGEESEETQTKGESIEWKTPTVKYRAAGIVTDGSGKIRFRRRANFNTEEEAIAWLHKWANIEAAEPMKAQADGTRVDTVDGAKANTASAK